MTLGVRDLATGEELLVERLEELNRRSGAARWRPRRLILINWWLFDEQVFHFAQGRLVLHGRNASGKSTVLAAAITLVLDGNKSPERMDTFGGRGRSVRYYLVGDPDATPESAFYHESRTGYVALEFQHGASARTLTVGVGLYTHRSRPGGEVDSGASASKTAGAWASTLRSTTSSGSRYPGAPSRSASVRAVAWCGA